jgi:ribosome maturation factor RimP
MEPAVRVSELIAPLLADRGFELFDVELTAGTLRVSIDRPGGVDLDAVSAATEVVSAALDRHDLVPGERYTLEVSSPGLERPLRTPGHFRRFVGTTVSVKTRPDIPGERRVEGRLDAADDAGITVAGRVIPYGDIERARTVFEWGPVPKPTSAKKRKAATP